MRIRLLIDNPKSWFVPFARQLKESLSLNSHDVIILHNQDDIDSCDFLFLLSCEKIIANHYLQRGTKAFVVHGSNLPEGRGWSPLTWEVLEGRREFYLSLIEASNRVDSGKVFKKAQFQLKGHELIDEMRQLQAEEICKLIIDFVRNPTLEGEDQLGVPTYYKKRSPADSELDIHKSLESQFNLLRVVDNNRYPAFFYRDGFKYIIQIYKAGDSE
jgi:methionyl-tRNA formyltransferase